MEKVNLELAESISVVQSLERVIEKEKKVSSDLRNEFESAQIAFDKNCDYLKLSFCCVFDSEILQVSSASRF
mgnify:CR=1 FL=1